jgi:hypothetical protein
MRATVDRPTRELLAKAEEARKKTTAPAKEVLDHLYRAVLALPEFPLKDGTKARFDSYIGPEAGKDGAIRCGVDVLLDNGSHLEFTITNTGWGKSFIQQAHSDRPRTNGPSR